LFSSFPVTFSILGKPSLHISLLNGSIECNKVSDLYININNSGSSSAYNLFLYITGSSLQLISGSSYSVGTLNPNESKIIKIKVYATSQQGSGSINFQLSGSDLAGNQITVSESFNIVILPLVRSSFNLLNSISLKIGRINNVSFIFQNNNHDKKNVLFSFSFPPQVIVCSLSNTFFSNFQSNSSVKVYASLYVPESLTSTVLVSTVTVSYYDEFGNNYVENLNVPIKLINPINLTIYGITQSPLVAYPNSSITLSGNILNFGSATAHNVNISLGELPQGFIASSLASYYLGDLSPSSPSPFSLSFYLDFNAKPGTYKIPILVQYMDDWRQQNQLVFTYQINVVNVSSFSKQQPKYQTEYKPINFVAVIVIIVAIALLTRFFIKKK